MSFTIQPRVWALVERLFIHGHSPNEFLELLERHGISYNGTVYETFDSYRPKPKYTFMSEDDYTFARFMNGVPSHRYLPLIREVLFDQKVRATQQDNWNYYGEPIRHWRPQLVELLHLGGVEVDEARQSLSIVRADEPVSGTEFLPHAFRDPFLDFIREEANEAYDAGLYLSVMFLSRKIIETTVVRLMEVVFPKVVGGEYSEPNHALWYDKSRGRLLGLDHLLDNLDDGAAEFHEDRELVGEVVRLIRPLKNETNACVHADYRAPDADYVNGWRIPHIMALLRKLFRKYCNP